MVDQISKSFTDLAYETIGDLQSDESIKTWQSEARFFDTAMIYKITIRINEFVNLMKPYTNQNNRIPKKVAISLKGCIKPVADGADSLAKGSLEDKIEKFKGLFLDDEWTNLKKKR